MPLLKIRFSALVLLASLSGCWEIGEPTASEALVSWAAFPDTVVILDLARLAGDRAVYMWTYEGTNTGPAGTGHRVRFNGWEQWTLDSNGLISVSDGRFDTAEYERQLAQLFQLCLE